MGDYTFCQIEAKDLSLSMATLVAAAFYAEDGYSGDELVKYAQLLLNDEKLTIEEIPVGFSGDLFEAVLAVIEETGIDFRFRLWEDPKSEWMGTIHYHIPGMSNVSAECGQDGDIRVSGSEIALRFPINTYFEDWIRNAACVKHVRAWNA
jgi:hypothetical protein